ncbi:hypothetical protein [Pasteurella sp. PK-2025]|uniref:hypothetical protein n=1 Tax=unclassified Pasteurella TaxID=2621516 RepID=UPI003C733F21
MNYNYPYFRVIFGFPSVAFILPIVIQFLLFQDFSLWVSGVEGGAAFLTALLCCWRKYTQENIYVILITHTLLVYLCLLVSYKDIYLALFILIPFGILGFIISFTNIVFLLPESNDQNMY